MVDRQTIAELVSRIPVVTWDVLREIKQRRPAMMLSELIGYSKRVSQTCNGRNYHRRPMSLLIQGRETTRRRSGSSAALLAAPVIVSAADEPPYSLVMLQSSADQRREWEAGVDPDAGARRPAPLPG